MPIRGNYVDLESRPLGCSCPRSVSGIIPLIDQSTHESLALTCVVLVAQKRQVEDAKNQTKGREEEEGDYIHMASIYLHQH